jgi:hypothetical protein
MRGISLRETQLARLIGALAELAAGRLNNGGTVTLTPSTTTTTVTRRGVGPRDHVTLTATTANAKTAAVAGLHVTTTEGAFTITHASNAAVDQTFTYAFQAGA